MELLTAARMRAIEGAAIESGAVTGLELMERAGRGVVAAILDWRPQLARAPGRALALCGPGNNGGDGFVVARLLAERGWTVDVFLYGDESRLPPDAATNCRRWRGTGDIGAWDDAAIADLLDRGGHDLVIDALFGTGLTRGLPEGMAKTLQGVAAPVLGEAPGRCVAIDIPSGVCSDSGANLGGAPRADLTVSFHAAKLGHVLRSERGGAVGGPALCGALRIADIGLSHDVGPAEVVLTEGPTGPLGKAAGGHKYGHGHALVLAGGVGKGGAARLAARGALRIGAGLVTVGAPPAAIIENAARLDAIMLRRIGDAAALATALEDRRFTAVALGPGLGVGAATRDMVGAALAGGGRGVALDADALTSFAEDPAALFALTAGRNAVLTPHMGEFGRLFPDLAARLDEPPSRGPAYSRVDAARAATARAGCVVLLKGPDTVVADAGGAASVVSAQYERACPWLATAGAGDVLTGMICGLLARGFAPKQAAETAAWLHQECAIAFGPGLIAEDLPETLPKVLRRLGV